MTLRKSLLLASVCASGIFASGIASRAVAQTAPAPVGATAPANLAAAQGVADAAATATPIKHLVVIFQENVSFDHYFGTYPTAANPPGEPKFTALPGTPAVNGLTGTLLTSNPNSLNTLNGTNAINPFRLDRSQAVSASQNHSYTPEQQAENNGAADLFPKYTGVGTSGGAGAFGTPGLVMGYYDGNTVTAMWNYAQHFAMSDAAYTDTYGPSTPGALEVVAGQTNGFSTVVNTAHKTSNYVADGQGGYTMINDIDPAYDVCSSTTDTGIVSAKNIGDLLNAAHLTWGGFMGGFNLNLTNTNGTTGCARSATNHATTFIDYVAHHNWFQYFLSTANPTHARPAALSAIGYTFDHNGSADPANHEYDLLDFYTTVQAGNFPSVSYVKLPAGQDGHAGYSDPLDEQMGVVKLVNMLESLPDWKNTAIIITYDDSDGWYDHAFTTAVHGSFDATADQLNGAGKCGATGSAPNGVNGLPVNGRCGPGVRIPFLVISPWANQNYVDHTQISQASVVRFIEDNWLSGQRLGGGSFDATAGSINGLFNFAGTGNTPALTLVTTSGNP